MNFYIIRNDSDDVVDCLTSSPHAVAEANKHGPGTSIDLCECPVIAETIRLMLAQKGGYATNFKTIYEVPTP